jgi:hypothetical protein
MNEAYPSRFYKAVDLNGRDLVVIIKAVMKETIGPQVKWVLYFQDDEKALVLNKTNNTTLVKMLGSNSTDWEGKMIALFPSTVEMKGETVACIRIRPVPKNTSYDRPAPVRPVQTAKDDMNDEVPF